MGKPHGTMAEKLKGVAAKLAADVEAEKKARDKAEAHKRQLAEQKKADALANRSDSDLFVEAMMKVGRADTVQKFDARPVGPGSAASSTGGPKEAPKTDEDVFSAAMKRLEK